VPKGPTGRDASVVAAGPSSPLPQLRRPIAQVLNFDAAALRRGNPGCRSPVGPDPHDPPALLTRVEAQADEEGVAVDLDLGHRGPAPRGPSPLEPAQDLVPVAAGRRRVVGRPPLHVGAQERADCSRSARSSAVRTISAMDAAVTGSPACDVGLVIGDQ